MCVIALLAAACELQNKIELVPILPSDAPALLSDEAVEYLDVIATSADGSSSEETQRLQQGDKLSMKLDEGTWTIEVRGMSDDREVVYGKTTPFQVQRGASEKVKFFLGRSGAFNEVALEPVDLAASMGDLFGHTAISFTDDDDHPWILVAGGKRSPTGGALAEAYLVDPIDFQVERLSDMSCTRFGHRAFTVETDDGTAVVLAGGEDGSCLGSLEVFNTATRTFEAINACDAALTRGAVPELASAGANGGQSGWVTIPGNPKCRVNVFNGESVTGRVMDSDLEVPKAPVMAQVNNQGDVLVIAQDVIYVDKALEDSSVADCYNTGLGSWHEAAVWSGLEERLGGRLHAFSNALFLFFGGERPGGDAPEYPWALVSTSECRISIVTEGGDWGEDQPLEGTAFIDLNLSGGIGLLATGGYHPDDTPGNSSDDLPTDNVYLFIRDDSVGAPTWHDLSNVSDRTWSIRMKRTRAGHAVATLDTGNSWIFGGGPAVAEIFVRGTEGITTEWEELGSRTPTLTAVNVLDTASSAPSAGAEEPSAAGMFKDAFFAEEGGGFFSLSADFRNLLFFSTSADQGLESDTLAHNPYGAETCDEAADQILRGVFLGDSSDVDTGAMTGSLLATTITDDARQAAVSAVVATSEGGGTCGWRQLLGAGLGGLRTSGHIVEPENDAPSLGVNVLFLVSTEDDCSEGVVDGAGSQWPDPTVLASQTCDAEGYDDFFGLPPTADDLDSLAQVVSEVSWDPADLIVAVMGNTGDDDECTPSDLEPMHRVRRLDETVAALEDMGASYLPVNLCEDSSDEAVAAAVSALVSMIQDRNPLQACLPTGMVDEEVSYVSARDQYEPVTPDKAVADDVALRCGLFYLEDVTEDDAGDDAPTHQRVRRVSTDDTEIAIDSDGRADCPFSLEEAPWLIRVHQDVVDAEVKDDLEFICLP